MLFLAFISSSSVLAQSNATDAKQRSSMKTTVNPIVIKSANLSTGVTLLILTFLTVFCGSVIFAQNKQTEIPKEVSNLVGTYTGSWTIYGLDANGQAVKQAAWTDTLKAENPVMEENRAFVTTTDEMTFEGGQIPPMKVSGREGYILNSDGSLGDYFIETNGQTYKLQKLSDNVWAYTVSATPQELSQLGVMNPSLAQHVLVKVVISGQGVETHNISRITTVLWKDASGKERTTQFVSLQGQHKRAT
jgi:hypothetical protein